MRQAARTSVPVGFLGWRRGGRAAGKAAVGGVVIEKPQAPAKISTKTAYECGQSIIEGEEHVSNVLAVEKKIAKSLTEGKVAESANSSSEPLALGKHVAVSQDTFVDALTAVMTGRVELGDGDDDDDISIATVSTINSCVGSVVDTVQPTTGGRTIGAGNLFFFLEQESPMKLPMAALSLNTAAETSSTQSSGPAESLAGDTHFSEASPPSPHPNPVTPLKENEMKRDEASVGSDSMSSPPDVRKLIAKKAKEADREGLFAIGQALFQKGERLLAQGKVEEAKEVLERAKKFQMHSLRLITKRMAETMHAQGLKHCDRGDKYLSIILLGVAEILKHRPNPVNIQLSTQVHLGYTKVCPKTPEYREPRKQIDECVKMLGEEAGPMAKTVRAYAKSVRLSGEQAS